MTFSSKLEILKFVASGAFKPRTDLIDILCLLWVSDRVLCDKCIFPLRLPTHAHIPWLAQTHMLRQRSQTVMGDWGAEIKINVRRG